MAGVSLERFMEILGNYIRWYNEMRTKLSGRHESIGIHVKSWIDLESVRDFVRIPEKSY